MSFDPIVRVHVGEKYLQFGVDEQGAFQEEDAITDPLEPVVDIAAVFGSYDIKIQWFEGDNSPIVKVQDMSPAPPDPGTGLGGGTGLGSK